jgi:hypothetical protein
MAPGFICSGGTSPGMTSSSPVEKQRHARAARHRQRGQPDAGRQAQRGRRPGAVPAAAPRRPGHVFARAADVLAGAATELNCTRPPSCATQSSCMTTASAPGGTGAPVKMRATVPGASGSPAAASCNALADGQRPALGEVGGSAPRSRPSRCCPGAAPAGRHQVPRQHAAIGVKGGDLLGALQRLARPSSRPALVQRTSGARAGA